MKRLIRERVLRGDLTLPSEERAEEMRKTWTQEQAERLLHGGRGRSAAAGDPVQVDQAAAHRIGKVVPPTVEAAEVLVGALPDRYRTLVLFAAGTGLRQGECFGLTLDRIEEFVGRRPQVRVDRQLVLVRGVAPAFGPPKTDASRRSVPFPLAVRDALAAHLAAFPAERDGLVFTNESGEGIRRT